MEFEIKAIEERPLNVDNFVCILPGQTVRFVPCCGEWRATDRTEMNDMLEYVIAGTNTKSITLPTLTT